MLIYRLSPHSPLEWSDFPVGDLKPFLAEHDVDLDRWEWKPTDARVFSTDMLRIALRHGVPTTRALVVEGIHTVDLGRGDEIRAGQQEIDELQANIRTTHGQFFESVMPGWTEDREQTNARARESTENNAREADDDLAEVLAAPIDPALTEHWTRIGGTLPDPA